MSHTGFIRKIKILAHSSVSMYVNKAGNNVAAASVDAHIGCRKMRKGMPRLRQYLNYPSVRHKTVFGKSEKQRSFKERARISVIDQSVLN